MKLQTETLYILAGPPASGKSTFLKNLRLRDPSTGALGPVPADFVFSADALRERFYGTRRPFVDTEVATDPSAVNDPMVHSTLASIVETRMRERLTTFVEAVLPAESDRNGFADLAHKHGMPVEVLFFNAPEDELLRRNAARAAHVPQARLKQFVSRMVEASKWPSRRVTCMADELHIIEDRRLIANETGIDVISDVHGLLEPLLKLVAELGYVVNPGQAPAHPQNRKLLFIGDVVDRGPDSVGVLRFVKQAVEQGGHYALRGNHEHRVLGFLRAVEDGALKAIWSKANAKTGFELLRLPQAERDALVGFLRSLPGYYVQGRVAFTHADLAQEFIPARMPLSDCVYGRSTLRQPEDSDAMSTQCNSRFLLVRGHIPKTSETDGVAVVYDDGEYGGRLVSMRLPAGGIQNHAEFIAARAQMVRVPTNFDYSRSRNTPAGKLQTELENLVKDKLVQRTFDPKTGLSLYKYAKTVFYDNLWHTHPALLRARGIVFGISGHLVQNPFTKVFNHLEAGTDLDPDTKVVVAPKLNGYLACVSLHPTQENALLVTTTGSFDSDFVALAQQAIKDHRAQGHLLRVLRKRRSGAARQDLTLMFEIVHPSDPHIVQYTGADYGLYLIGARSLDVNALELTEAELDGLAADIGPSVRREPWFVARFGDIVAKAQSPEAVNVEGWMIREHTPEQKTIMKKKSTWYLTTKFVGRLSDSKARFMFDNPKVFKRSIDEEFQTLVDKVTSAMHYDEFVAMEQVSRVSLIASMLV